MHLHQSTGERQAEAQPAPRSVHGLLGLSKELEDSWQHFSSNADSRIGDAKNGFAVFAHDIDVYRAAARREFDRVVQHVGDDLRQPRRVGAHEDRLGSERQPMLASPTALA